MAIEQLLLVAKIEQEKEDELALEYQKAQNYLNEHRQRLRGIEDYKLQYLKQMQLQGQTGMTGQTFTHFNNFINKLDAASQQQTQIVNTATQVTAQRRNSFLEQQKKRKAIEMLIKKDRQREQLLADKKEQKLLDEISTQRFIQQRKKTKMIR